MKEGCENCDRPVSRDETYATVVLKRRNGEEEKRVYCGACIDAAFDVIREVDSGWLTHQSSGSTTTSRPC